MIPVIIEVYQQSGKQCTSRVVNSADPDQVASQKPADLDLHCFQNNIYHKIKIKKLYLMMLI